MKKGDRVIFAGDMHGKITKTFIAALSRQQMAHIVFDNGAIISLYTKDLEFEEKTLGHKDPNLAFVLKKKRML